MTSRAFNGAPTMAWAMLGAQLGSWQFIFPKDLFLGDPAPREKQELRLLLAWGAQASWHVEVMDSPKSPLPSSFGVP